MKNSYLLLLVLLLSVTVQSQIPENAVSLEDALFDASFTKHPAVPKVNGKLLNITQKEIKALTITYSLVTPFQQVSKTARLAPDGSFKLALDYAFPYQQIWLSVGDDLFYTSLTANKDLFVELDIKKIKATKELAFNGDGVRYLGTDGPLNIYLNNYILYNRPGQQEISKRLYELIYPPKPVTGDIRPAYDRLFEEIKKIQDSYVAEHPSAYSWILENERLSDYYAKLCPRYWNKVMDDTLWQKMRQHKSYLVSNSGSGLYRNMVTYLRLMPIDRVMVSWKDVAVLPDLDPSETAYIDSLQTYENKRLNHELSANAFPYTSENSLKWFKKLQSRASIILLTRSVDKTIHQLDSLFIPAKADFLKMQLNTSKDPIEQKATLEHVVASMHTNWCSKVVNAEYKRTIARIKEINGIFAKSTMITAATGLGKPVMETNFGARMYELSDMHVKDFLAKLKQRFQNKAIILDLWATWCGPCLSEMPHSKKLLEETKDLPVVFVYLCTTNGSDKNKWKTKVAELKQPGIHYFIDVALDAGLMDYFSFSGYPGYAFIDQNGNYKPGAIQRISQIDKDGLIRLLNLK